MPSTLVVTIGRAELSLATLTLTDPGTYDIDHDTLEPGVPTWIRQLVRSPYVEGATEVGATRDLGWGTARFVVQGSTHATIQTRLDTLVDAFFQSSYTLSVVIDGTTYSWTCMRADCVGWGLVSDESFFGLAMPVAFRWPRQPVPVSGPL